MKRIIFLFALASLFNCKPDPTEMVPFVKGYWMIDHVTKDGETVMNFSTSPIVDYWQINDEDLSGFRKKVMPNLDGKLIVTQHIAPFKLEVVDHKLNVNYNDNGNTFSETIVEANKDILVISDAQGMIYTYKPHETDSEDE